MVITRIQPVSELFSPVIEDLILPHWRMADAATRLPDADLIATRDHSHARQIETTSSR